MSTEPWPVHSVDKREDPVARQIRDLTAEEFIYWLVRCHGLPQPHHRSIESNLREQFKWHRLQGRLDRRPTAALVAELLLMRRSVQTLARSEVADPLASAIMKFHEAEGTTVIPNDEWQEIVAMARVRLNG